MSYFRNSPLVRLALICRSEPSEISSYDWSAVGDWRGKRSDIEVEGRMMLSGQIEIDGVSTYFPCQ